MYSLCVNVYLCYDLRSLHYYALFKAAETGSGKTGAFSLPVVQIVWERRKDMMNPQSGGGNAGMFHIFHYLDSPMTCRGNKWALYQYSNYYALLTYP